MSTRSPGSQEFAFFTERQVGIGSAAEAIEPYVRRAPNVTWTDVTYSGNGWVERLRLPGRVGGTLRGYLQARETLRRGRYDALFFLTHNPAVFRPRTLARTPTVLWTDVTPSLLDEQAEQYGHSVDRHAFLRTLKRTVVLRTFRLAFRCIGWSDWARSSFVRDYGVPEDRTAVVPPGVDLARWQAPETRPCEGLPRLLFVGGNFERKGGKLLLEVFRARFRGRAELDLVTRDPVAEEPGVRVHHGLTPKSEALLDLYRRASCFVLPTLGDCFSIASLEAMAMRLPVISTRVGGIPEIIEEGSSGHLVNPGDGHALATALDAVLKNPEIRAHLGTRGRKLVVSRFNAELTAARLLEIMSQGASLYAHA